MAEQNKVILYGMYASPYAKAVELVLKVKGIPFEYKEEDLLNKSESLLKFNPVHKKVPVLVHNGKAIAESLVIIEYIDEVWKTKGPQFLPEDPFQRSQVRFWAGYICQVFESLTLVFVTTGEAQDKAIKATYEKLDTLEEGLKGLYPNGKFTSSVEDYSKNVTLIELLIVSFYGAYEALNEAIDINFIDPEKTPLVFSCIRSLIQIPAVKEAHAPHEKMVSFLKFFREYALKSGYHY